MTSLRHLSWCVGAGALALTATALAQPQQLATDRVEALMLASDGKALPIHEERLTIEIATAADDTRVVTFRATGARAAALVAALRGA